MATCTGRTGITTEVQYSCIDSFLCNIHAGWRLI